MQVKVHLYTQSEPCFFEGVRNAYQKGDLYCILCETGEVYKFPLQHIFRVKETDLVAAFIRPKKKRGVR